MRMVDGKTTKGTDGSSLVPPSQDHGWRQTASLGLSSSGANATSSESPLGRVTNIDMERDP